MSPALARVLRPIAAKRAPVLIGAVVGAVLAGGAAVAIIDGGSDSVPTVFLTARHSKFSPAGIAVEPGTKVRFVVRNVDPIAHEFIIGPSDVHEKHEKGTHAAHGAVPGEVSVAAGEEAETTYIFDRAGTVAFGCHLPGHWDYGMHGLVEVGPT